MNDSGQDRHAAHAELPPIDSISEYERPRGFFSSIFGGDTVERRPLPIMFVIFGIIFIGFVIGTLITMGILSGMIEINPKAIKAVLKTFMGKSP